MHWFIVENKRTKEIEFVPVTMASHMDDKLVGAGSRDYNLIRGIDDPEFNKYYAKYKSRIKKLI